MTKSERLLVVMATIMIMIGVVTNPVLAAKSNVSIGNQKFYLNECTLVTDEYGNHSWEGSYAPAGWKGYPYITILFPLDQYNTCK